MEPQNLAENNISDSTQTSNDPFENAKKVRKQKAIDPR